MPQAESTEALTPKTLRYLYAATILYLAAHLLLITQFSSRIYLSGLMIPTLGLLKIACCLWCFARLSTTPARFRWLAYACGALLANASMQIYVWRDALVADHDYLSLPASLFTSLACIPILVSLTFNFRKKDPPVVRWIDLAIGLTLGGLFTV